MTSVRPLIRAYRTPPIALKIRLPSPAIPLTRRNLRGSGGRCKIAAGDAARSSGLITECSVCPLNAGPYACLERRGNRFTHRGRRIGPSEDLQTLGRRKHAMVAFDDDADLIDVRR